MTGAKRSALGADRARHAGVAAELGQQRVQGAVEASGSRARHRVLSRAVTRAALAVSRPTAVSNHQPSSPVTRATTSASMYAMR